MGTLSNTLPCTCLHGLLWTCFFCCVIARPSDIYNSDSRDQDGAGFGFGVWVAAAASFVCISVGLAVCVCCRKPKGFAEFRSSTQLAEISSAQPAEVTLFPPPSLFLNREDLEVSFEPLPRPQHEAVNTYRTKEANEWMENGHGLFPRSNIQYLREVGRGWFGQVVEAEVKDLLGDQVTSRCVVKILRPEASAPQHSKFLRDVQPLLKLSHPHVMKLYGCCLETSPFLVLLQHCANGDLKQFLAAYSPPKGSQGAPPPPLPENVLLRMAYEAAEGLSQWHGIGFCHSDVAARSFMVTGDMSVVIGDYGTHTVAYRDDFFDTGHQLLPVRWCAPECFDASGEILQTLVGNVWSFGVVLWEILSIGARPYATLTDEQVLQQVVQEKRTILNPPSFSYQQSHALYQLMLHCWEVDALLRPRMEVVVSRLAAACAGVNRDIELDLERAFDSRWNAAKPSKSSLSGEESPSASLNNLHGSLDNLEDQSKEVLSPGTDKESESGFSAKVSAALRSLDEALAAAEAGTDEEVDDNEDALPEPSFELGELQAEQAEAGQETDHSSNSSLFSSRSWQDKVTRGDLTALVREKSRSVQDLMVLTHVEPMSDIEFLSFNQGSKSDQQHQSPQQPPAPQISVTSPSFTVRSPMMESDVPLLGSNISNSIGKDSLDTGTYMARNRNRLTSTPRDDTNFEAMESSFRDQTKQTEYAPFSPESLDATQFTPKDQESNLSVDRPTSASTSVILGPSDDLGLNVFQGVKSATEDEDDPFDEPEAVAAAVVAIQIPPLNAESPLIDPDRLAVNLEAWNNFLEQSYPHQQPHGDEQHLDDETPPPLKDSGIARPSFSASIDVLGSTLGNEDSVNREWMDDLSLVARMWNEELAAALALDSSLLQAHQLNASLTDTDPNLEEGVANASGLSNDLSFNSPARREETYFSYDKIDEDIREEQREMSRSKDLSTIREERESVSSSELGATPHSNADTGRGILTQLQLKNRMQRHLDLSCSSESDGSEDCRDDDEEVLVVDLENKRAVMLEGQSPKLRAAIATQNYEDIFVVRPTNAHSIMENGKSPSFNGKASTSGADATEEYDNDEEEDEAHGGEEEEDDDEGEDGDVANDFEDEDDDDDDDEGDEGIAVSHFQWQACYPAKLNQSFSMEVIEEESEPDAEDDDEDEAFVPSIWKADATPTRPAIKSPDKTSAGNSPRDSANKNVSFSQKKKKDIYKYPAEVEEPTTPTRRQWGAPTPVIQQPKDSYADFADWDFANADEDRESETDCSKDVEEPKPVIPRPPNPLSSNMLYRLSGIENESEDDDAEHEAAPIEFDGRPNEFLGEWKSPFNLSEFQPNQFFPNWDNPSTATNNEERSEATNGHIDGNEEPNVVGTLRHTLDSGRLHLDLTPSRLEDSEA